MNLSLLQSPSGQMPLSRRQRRGPSPMKPRAGDGAFTLIELLVVITIIVILAALSIPAINSAMGSANSVKCVSNLKQIGTGIALYVADNDGVLPGPLSGAQSPMYGSFSPGNGRLAQYLQGYISPDVPVGGGMMLSPLFVCPGFAKVMKVNSTSLPYNMNGNTLNGMSHSMWGAGAGTANPTPGYRLASLRDGTTPPSEIWAMKDTDAADTNLLAGNTGLVGSTNIPSGPVHPTYKAAPVSGTTNSIQQYPGCYRNALFFDFHVGRLNLDNTVQ